MQIYIRCGNLWYGPYRILGMLEAGETVSVGSMAIDRRGSARQGYRAVEWSETVGKCEGKTSMFVEFSSLGGVDCVIENGRARHVMSYYVISSKRPPIESWP